MAICLLLLLEVDFKLFSFEIVAQPSLPLLSFTKKIFYIYIFFFLWTDTDISRDPRQLLQVILEVFFQPWQFYNSMI